MWPKFTLKTSLVSCSALLLFGCSVPKPIVPSSQQGFVPTGSLKGFVIEGDEATDGSALISCDSSTTNDGLQGQNFRIQYNEAINAGFSNYSLEIVMRNVLQREEALYSLETDFLSLRSGSLNISEPGEFATKMNCGTSQCVAVIEPEDDEFTRGDADEFGTHMEELEESFGAQQANLECDFRAGDEELILQFQEGTYDSRPSVRFVEIQKGFLECEDQDDVEASLVNYEIYLKDDIFGYDISTETFNNMEELRPQDICPEKPRTRVEAGNYVERKDNLVKSIYMGHKISNIAILERADERNDEPEVVIEE